MRTSRALLIMILFSALACSHLTLHRGEGLITGDTQIVSDDYYLWGFGSGHGPFYEKDLCPNSRIETMDMKMTGSDVLISLVTLGIYVPNRLEITCYRTAGP